MTTPLRRDDLRRLNDQLVVIEAGSLALIRDLVLDRVNDPGNEGDPDLARARTDRIHRLDRLARDIDLARDLACDLPRDLVHEVDRLDDLIRYLDRAHDLVHDLVHDRVFARDLTRVLARHRNLAHDLNLDKLVTSARSRVDAALAAVTTELREVDFRPASRPATAAVRVLYQVVQVLPEHARPRYREEFEAELVELAIAGISRSAQFAYAVELAARMWSLRRALRSASSRQERAQ